MLSGDDYFRADAVTARQEKIQQLEAETKVLGIRQAASVEASKIIRTKGQLSSENIKQFTNDEIRILCKWKLGKKPACKKSDLVKMYLDAPNPPQVMHWWVNRKERELQALKSYDVPIE